MDSRFGPLSFQSAIVEDLLFATVMAGLFELARGMDAFVLQESWSSIVKSRSGCSRWDQSEDFRRQASEEAFP